MVKLAQTIGASGIAQGTRQMMSFGSNVIEVRQNLYDDKQQKNAIRVFPFSDIQYAGAEVAGKNSVIASCFVPVVASLDVDGKGSGLERAPVFSLKQARNIAQTTDMDGRNAVDDTKWMQMGFGMADYIFGINQNDSYNSAGKAGTFDATRRSLYSTKREASVDGTSAIRIKQYLTESQALDEITAQPSKMIIGYVIGPRDVKLYYTETAIGMMVRRMRRVVEALGPLRPRYYPLGLGHLMAGKKPWQPAKAGTRGKTPRVVEPSTKWSAGAVQYKQRALKAAGTMYIPGDQVPYGTMRRNFKYNHIMTQLGMEMMETLQAIGVDLSPSLVGATPVGQTNRDGSKAYTDSEGAGTQVAALQMLFASMFGSTSAMSTTNDFTVDEASVAAAIKDKLGMLFNSGHIHIDPGVFSYERSTSLFSAEDGMLSTDVNGLTYKGKNMSPAGIMQEFVSRYITFAVAAQCLESYMSVPLFQCHWLYVGSPKPEYVTEQLQMNFRPDVHFDGDNAMPFTLIPKTLNPGQVLCRVPTYLDCSGEAEPNSYLGIRDPLPYGNVLDIRFNGDKPMTTTEETDYTFTPIIEADSMVQTQYRNSRTVNCAVWPRPTHYSPGATRVGAIYGMMSDNASVGGDYYYQPMTGALVNDQVEGDTPVVFRAMKNAPQDSKLVADALFQGMDRETQDKQQDYWDKHEILPKDNPQTTEQDQNLEPAKDAQVFPGTTSGRREG